MAGSNTTWIAALFVASSASTGIAAIVLLDRWLKLDIKESVIEHLEKLDSWVIALEICMLVVMALSLGRLSRAAFGAWPGVLIPGFVVPAGLIFPLAIKRWGGTPAAASASMFVLLGGFALRAAVIGMPSSLLAFHPG